MIKEITMFEFDEFSKKHAYGSFYQSSDYAILAAEDGFDYDYVGYYENNSLVAAALILIKKLSFNKKYGYASRGFLIDYNDSELFERFTKAIKKYYKRKLIFIKINPLLVTKEFDSKLNLNQIYNLDIINYFEDLGYKKLRDNLNFEAQLPRFDAVINLEDFSLESTKKNVRNKVNKACKKGLIFEKADKSKLEMFYSFINRKDKKSFKYYNNLFRIFEKNDCIDLFLVKIDYEKFMEASKENYEKEIEVNSKYNNLLKSNQNDSLLNKKMISDKLLVNYKNDIMEASRKYSDNQLVEYLAGALVIKHSNKVFVISSGFNKSMKHLNANHFLHYNIANYYKDKYDRLYLNGMSGDFSIDSPYYKLNKFKLGFNPTVEEYIGELDLILDQKSYNNLLVTGKLHKEFDLKDQ